MKLYLAGFDVFAEDAKKRGEDMKTLCREYGFEGLYPLDNEFCEASPIFLGNLSMIDRADGIVANVNAFRGKEPDSGTAFEIGYAFAKGKDVFLYLSDSRTLRQKLGEKDEDGFSVEDFSLPVNLMLGCAANAIVTGSLKDCLQAASSYYRINRK